MHPIRGLSNPLHNISMWAEFPMHTMQLQKLTHRVSSRLQTILCVGELLGESHKWGSGWMKERVASSICM